MTSKTSGDWVADLRARGYRMTPQRRLVLDAVVELGHATPDEILEAVRRRSESVNISTVYRTLELLEDFGLVTHAHLGHGAPTYHPGNAPAHAHLVCRGCGDVVAVEPEVVDPLVRSLRRHHGFEPDIRHLTVHGLCSSCTP